MKPSALLDAPQQARETPTTAPKQGERRTDIRDGGRQFDFRGPWLRTDAAAAYTGRVHADGSPNRDAFRKWAIRHGIVMVRSGKQGNLLVSKADLDRALEVR